MMKGISWLLQLLFLLQMQQQLSYGEMSDKKLMENIRAKLNKRWDTSTKIQGSKVEKLEPLPTGNMLQSPGPKLTELSCQGTYSVVNPGLIRFKMASPDKKCEIHFVGSRAQQCTVAFMCDGGLTAIEGGASSGGFCDKGYLILEDGTNGRKSWCGSFDFKQVPRVSRNGGHDLFIEYRGSSNSSMCGAYCLERVPPGASPEYRKPKKLCRKRKYQLQESSKCTCGKRRDVGRVVGGKDALKFEFPWIGPITYKWEHFEREVFCGGTLINNQYFLTAAHCFDDLALIPQQFTLHAHLMGRQGGGHRPDYVHLISGWDLPQATDAEENSVRLDFEEHKVHPLYKGGSTGYDYDVAIAKFKQPLDFFSDVVNNVYPICLPTVENFIKFNEGDKMVIAGWGFVRENTSIYELPLSRFLQKADVNYFSFDTCQKFDSLTYRHICAGHREGKIDQCQGDSGGPLIGMLDRSKNQYVQAGIVSQGVGCARPEHPGWYTNVQEVLQWIYKHTSEGSLWCKR